MKNIITRMNSLQSHTWKSAISTVVLASFVVALSGCGGGDSGDTADTDATVVNEPVKSTEETTGGDTSVADSGTNDSNDTDNAGNTAVNSSAELVTSAEFDFAAARTIDIDFDVPEARTAEGMLSLCNEYTKSGESYDINYDSCTVQARLVNGVYNGKMALTNNVNSVIGVVWFADSSLSPVYKEFSLENTASRYAARSADSQPGITISWQ